MQKNKGFTLIELLVVIAIIGILASVVLASLNSARTKGNEAKIASQIAGARVSAEIYYSNNTNSYGTTDDACNAGIFADSTSGMAQYTLGTNYPSGTTISCDSNGTAYALKATFNSKYWCVDSTGASVIGTATNMAIAGDSNCDTDNT